MAENKKDTQSKIFVIATVISVLALILIILFLVVFRPVTNADIKMEVNDDFSLNINITITPNININNLQVTFNFADKDKNIITSKKYTLGNVKSSIPYSITYRLSDFTVSQLSEIYYVTYDVSGGMRVF